MNEGDGLPSLICHRCLYHIERVNEFKMLCEQSDAFLRQHLSLQFKSNVKEFGSDGLEGQHVNGLAASMHIENGNSRLRKDWIKEEPVEKDVYKVSSGHSDPQCDSEDGELNCPSCNKHFDDSNLLERHVLIHSQDGPFPCDFCDVIEKDKASLRFHWKEHAGQYANICQTCGDAFNSKDSLLKHNLRHDKAKPYHCEVCQKAFSYKSDLRKHSIIHTGLRPYVCPVCYKSFTRSTNLNKHARLHSGRRPFACNNCDKMFASRGDLLRHSVIHTGEKPYSCSVCSISFNRRDKLTRHEKVHVGGRAHPCSECPTSFNRKEELTKHFQFHHFSPELYYGCSSPLSSSLSTYKKENDLRLDSEDGGESEALVINVDPSHWSEGQMSFTKNVNTPDDWRPFNCESCHKKFRHRRELTRHTAVHTGIRPYSCFTCGKSFIRSDKLKRHLLTHGKKESWEVEMTRSNQIVEARSSSAVLTNELNHSQATCYQCMYCSISYCKRIKLVKHIKKVHIGIFSKCL